MLAGHVIVLNGSDPATTQQVAQMTRDRAKNKYVLFGRGCFAKYILNTNEVSAKQRLGPMHAMISGLARNGCNVIVDHSIETKEQFDQLSLFLCGIDVVWIRLKTARVLKLCLGIPYEYQCDIGAHNAAHCTDTILSYLKKRKLNKEPNSRWVPHLSANVEYPYGDCVIISGSSQKQINTLCEHIIKNSDSAFYPYPLNQLLLSVLAPNLIHLDENNIKRLSADKQGGLYLVRDKTNLRLQIGDIARRALSGLFTALLSVLRAGYNIISAQQYYYVDWHDEMSHNLFNQNAIWLQCTDSLGQTDLETTLAAQLHMNINFDIETNCSKDMQALSTLVLQQLSLAK